MSLAFAQGGGGRGGQRGFGRGNQFSELALVQRKDVQKDLGLTDDQVTKITDYVEKNRAQRGQGGAGAGGGGQRGGGGNGGAGGGGQLTDEQRAAMQKAAEERRQKTRNDLKEIIGEAGLKRVDEIGIQLQGNLAILLPAVQKELGLSPDQITKIQELQKAQQDANRTLFQKVRDQEITQEDMRSMMTKNNDKMKEELGKILTGDQPSKLKAMGGKPFTADAGGN